MPSPGGGFSLRRIELDEKVREGGRERERRDEIRIDRALALYLGEASKGRIINGRGVWWSAALQGRDWPRSML